MTLHMEKSSLKKLLKLINNSKFQNIKSTKYQLCFLKYFIYCIYIAEAEGKEGRIPSRLHAEHRARGGVQSQGPEIMTGAEITSQTPIRLSHPGAPISAVFIYTNSDDLKSKLRKRFHLQ